MTTWDLPLQSNTWRECRRREPTQSQPASALHSVQRHKWPIIRTQTNTSDLVVHLTHTVTKVCVPPSGQKSHSLCWWADSVASDLDEERFDCDRKRGLSAAGTWRTAADGDKQTNKMLLTFQWQPEGHHQPIKLSNIGCICIWLNLSPSQFQDPDPHCSCQNTSSNPAGDKRHALVMWSPHAPHTACWGRASHLITIFKHQGELLVAVQDIV